MNGQTAMTGHEHLHWRVGVYDRQRGTTYPHLNLTPRQRRRALHKLNHARAPFGRKHPLAEIAETLP